MILTTSPHASFEFRFPGWVSLTLADYRTDAALGGGQGPVGTHIVGSSQLYPCWLWTAGICLWVLCCSLFFIPFCGRLKAVWYWIETAALERSSRQTPPWQLEREKIVGRWKANWTLMTLMDGTEDSVEIITVKEKENDAALRRRRYCCWMCVVDTWLGPHLGLGTTLGQRCMNYSNGVGVRSAPNSKDYCAQPFWAQLKDLEGSPIASRSSTPLGGWFFSWK